MASPAPYERVVVVTRKTELDELVERFATAEQARFYLEHAGQPFQPIKAAHERYRASVSAVRAAVPRALKVQVLDRNLVPQYSFGDAEIVVTVGQDGLVSNTAKYLSGQPLIGVNPDPARYDGVLLPFPVDRFPMALSSCLQGKPHIEEATLALAELNDGQRLLAFNDFFIGAASHVSARYRIRADGHEELQSSSGVIVSTGAGSTGWLSSVHAGAIGIVRALGRGTARGITLPPLARQDERLIYTVREPFPSNVTGTSIVYGAITPSEPLVITSQMGTNGVIFSDGVESDFLAFNHGTTVKVSIAPQKARLVVPG